MKNTVPRLQKGDLVGVVALSSVVNHEKLGDALSFFRRVGSSLYCRGYDPCNA
ncbi:hypothetical protein OL548_33435 [Lysinibacillus sp. MHQ-1]|nr:hypothetical protein OL548_33435 [Lysinibacillus sp. MHQ-1]